MKPLLHIGSNEQECRYELRADVSRNGDMTTQESLASDVKRRIAFVVDIVDVRSGLSQSIYKRCNGALQHTLRTGDGYVAPLLHRVVCSEKAHCSTGGIDVYDRAVACESVNDNFCIVALSYVDSRVWATGQRIDNECAVADTLGCRQLNDAGVRVRCCYVVSQCKRFFKMM